MNSTKLKKLITKKEAKKDEFIQELSLHMGCLKYITDRIETRQGYFEIIKILSKIDPEYKVEYLKIKMYEFMLLMSETEKAKIFYDDNITSETLFSLYRANNRYFKDHLPQLKETASKIELAERTARCTTQH